MSTEIVMPNLGFDTQEARLIEWLKQPGDEVAKGEVIAIIESDKANVELESLVSGTLLECLYPADTEIQVGAVIARIGSADEAPTPKAAPADSGSTGASAPASAASSVAVEVSPVARRIAQENNIDLGQVQGSGPRGRIIREDVMAYIQTPTGNGHSGDHGNYTSEILALPKVRKAAREAGIDLSQIRGSGQNGIILMDDLVLEEEAPAPAPTPVQAAPALAPTPPQAAPARTEIGEGVQEIKLSSMRQLIGERLGQSKRDAPHFYVTGEFDLEDAIGKLATLREPQPRINDLLQYLTVQTLLEVPELNARFENGRLLQHQSVDLAIAVALEGGLITPVLAGADRFSLSGLAQESRALIGRARENRLKPADLQGGTFTMSNLGIIKQVDHFTAVINPPQVGILAIGTVKQRPVVLNGGLHIRHTVHLTLSGDHRVVDGMHLARFMAVFQEQLSGFSK